MKTAEQIIAYLEMELADAYKQHDQAKGKDAQAVLIHLIRATTILNLLEGIKADVPAAEEETRTIKPGRFERMLMNGEITEEEYKKKKAFYVETLFELYALGIITEEELKERLNK